jgi:lipid-A-disaccharide synthase
MVKRVMMVAGEASGDLHGSGVVRELRQSDPGIEIFGIGGDAMRQEGMELVQHISSMSFMGFVEVVKHLSAIRAVERQMEMLLESRRPDVVVLIDFPGFNLRLAANVKRQGIPLLYYISPQVWAWNRGRIKKMKHLVDRMKVVFPFEVDLYRAEGIDVEFVGHPIVERIGSSTNRQDFFRRHGLNAGVKLLGLFPGSRIQELERILPVMADVAVLLRERLGIEVALGVAPNLGSDVVKRFLPRSSGITLVENATYDLMNHADAAIVTSGTATLETGWFGTPMVVVYRTSPLTYFIGRLLVDVPYIGLVNIVAGNKVVPELVQGDMTAKKLVSMVSRLLTDEAYAQGMRKQLSVIRRNLGQPGASRRVADGVLALGSAA